MPSNKESRRITVQRNVSLVSVRGDITLEHVDAIVNAANTRLVHGGGVAGAIARKGGPAIQAESMKIAPVPTGSAASTSGGGLPCRRVIHAVGPVWGGGTSGEDRLLAAAVMSALKVASHEGAATVSFPAISTGIFGYPAADAVRIIVSTTIGFLDAAQETTLREIRFCNIDPALADLFDKELDSLGRRNP